MNKEKKPNIFYQDEDYRINKPFLLKIADIYAGNKNIKRKGETYLSKFTNESEEKYSDRLKYATFFPHFRQSLSKLENMIFRKGITIKNKDNKKYENLLKNFDGEGSSLETVMKLVAKNSLLDGICYLWVDAPFFEEKITYKDKENIEYLPFVKIIKRIDVINKRTTVEKGKTILTKIVIEQLLETEGDGFQPETIKTVIVLEIGGGKVYSESGEVLQEWTNSLNYIPFFPVYSSKTGYLQADIPFLDLADMNIKHYNAESNLDHINKMVSSPTPLIFEQSEIEGTLTIGVNNAMIFNDKNTGGAEYLEVQGKGITHLENAVKEIEIKMDKMSLNAIYTNTFRTATEARFNEEKNNLFLVEIATSLEYGVNLAFEIMNDFLGENKDIDYEVELSKDFVDLSIEPAMVDELIKLCEKGFISRETMWKKLIDSEIFEPFDFEEEINKIKK